MRTLRVNRVAFTTFFGNNFLLFFIVFLYLIVGGINHKYLSLVALKNIITQASIIGVLSIGMTFVIISGGIDLSVGSVMALTSIITAWTNLQMGFPFIISLILGVLVGFLSGILGATFILYLKLPPFISTLGLLIMFSGLARFIGEDNLFSGLPDAFNFLWTGEVIGIPLPVLIFLGLAMIAHIVKENTAFGRNNAVIGSNYRAAVICGVNIKKSIYIYYMISGVLATIAGLFMTARLNSGQALIGKSYEMFAITAAVVGGASLTGGIGSIKGAVYGAILISIIYTGISFIGLSSYYQEIFIGFVLIIAVLINRLREESNNARLLLKNGTKIGEEIRNEA
ncbi:MAG: ABC transporter permease [Syntrophales bacterium]